MCLPVLMRLHVFCRETLEVDPTPTSADSPKRNLRYELYNFWKHNYSANLMCACLVHDESLDRMEEIAKENFLAIGNKNIPERIWPSKPFRDGFISHVSFEIGFESGFIKIVQI